MSYLQFDKQQLINLNYALKRELLRSNRAGSYSNTTITFCNTRKYHGILVCPIPELDNENHVLVSGLDETIIQHGQEFHFGSRKYPGNNYSPLGHKYIREFNSEPIPQHIYRVGGVLLKKELLLTEEDENILIRYTLLDAHSSTRIKLQPFLAFRQVHKLSKANMYANHRFDSIPNGIKMRLYEGYPFLNMQCSVKNEYTHAPDWYYNVEYMEEMDRGYEAHEDLFSPGFFEMEIEKDKPIIFSAGLTEMKPETLNKKYNAELKSRIPRDNYINNLKNSAQQFFVKRDKKTYVIAGFPWFGVWARDTFISLPGLTLAQDDAKACKSVLNTMSGHLHKGLFPNMGTDPDADVNSVDAPLWYVWAVQQYALFTDKHKEVWKEWGKHIIEILENFKSGTRYGIMMKENSLIYAGAPGKALTWMDALVFGEPVTQRKGFNVEINALWYNAIQFALEVAQLAGDHKFVDEWKDMPEKVAQSFLSTFWNDEKAYLADYADEKGPDWSVRPNMVFATSLPYSPLNEHQKRAVLYRIEKELLTPKGLRTLSPAHEKYKGKYVGNQPNRDASYHQGTVWPWLLGHYAEGLLRVNGVNAIPAVERMYFEFEKDMTIGAIGTIPEIYDGDPPHDPKGATSQAWSVAEVLRMAYLIEKYKQL